MYACARTVTVQGATAHLVDVQVDVAPGMVGTTLIGRPDTAVSEARERCRSAVNRSGYRWPATRRVTILLSPADLPKRGSHFDLAIALGVLCASDDDLHPDLLDGWVFLAELSLDGRVRCVPGVLPMVLAARQQGYRRVMVPEPQLAEARMVGDIEVYGIRSLAQAIAILRGDPPPEAPPVELESGAPLMVLASESRIEELDFADVVGMSDARFALEVAAAGGHHVLLIGPKGAGKTTLAERVPSILPDLSPAAAFELTTVHSLCGSLTAGADLLVRPPFRAPHHSASRAGILGGGSGRVVPGELSKAHHGVLFLDEFTLLPRDITEALRQPLESGAITIARGDEEATFPAEAMVLLAANPCPCGEYGSSDPAKPCQCPTVRLRDYRSRLTGPMIDRIDVTRSVTPLASQQIADPMAIREGSEAIRQRVAAARERQRDRYEGERWSTNGWAPGSALTDRWPMTPDAMATLDQLIYAGKLTRRGATRVHRLAWTIADLRCVDQPGIEELEVARRLRAAETLDSSMLWRDNQAA